ncbi:MAG TPA: DUF11 domain-containing protein [Candidatus Sulfotelmatobacter sp.]|nr:DUF11 domain-containing protein [Candidatus Sulfotelmatobacter sp.]
MPAQFCRNKTGSGLRWIWGAALIPLLLCVLAAQAQNPSTINAPDCNDPDAHDLACTELTRALVNQAHTQGYPYYLGHAEPRIHFFSTRGTSGYDMQYKIALPLTEPAPKQDGSAVANFELYSAFWLGLSVCDPNSGAGGACVADSDTNNPSTAGSGFLELQFFPPGDSCGTTTQWCALLHINTFQNFNAFTQANCKEPTTATLVTTNGVPGGPTLFMNNGDSLVVTIQDTAAGLETDIDDLTTSTTGSMVASSGNGFVHNANQTDCTTTAFTFHPEFATASPGQGTTWASGSPNVSWAFEIGHWELCGDSGCATLPDGGDADDTGCGAIRGIGGCTGSDLDHDGTPYLADWPSGNAAYPDSFIFGSPDNKGVGPMSAHPTALTTYDEGYLNFSFFSTEGTTGTFYPFYSQAGTGTSCVFNFGNDITGTTTNDFGQRAQFDSSILNPCLPGISSDLSISKSGPATAAAGTNVTYSIVVSNFGPSNATGVTVTDTLPPGVTLVSTSIACTNAAGTLTCPIGALADTATSTFTVTVHIPSSFGGGGSITNFASVTGDQIDSNPNNNNSSATTGVLAVADLATSKTGPTNPVAAGTNITYTIGVSNAGPSDAPNVVVTDTLPVGVNFVSSTAGCSGTTVLTCNLGTLVNGASTSFNVTVGVPANYLSSRSETTTSISQTAAVTSSATDPNLLNNTATVNTTLIAVADLSIAKSAAPNPVDAGTPLKYTITVSNAGPSDSTGTTVTDVLPAGVNFTTSSIGCSGTTTLTCPIGTLAAGATTIFTVTVAIPANYLSSRFEKTATITNTATVAPGAGVTDPNLVNNTASVSTTVIQVADVEIAVSEAPNPVHQGGTATYTMTFKNTGPSDAPFAQILQYSPAGFIFAGSTYGTCSPGVKDTVCSLGPDMPVGYTQTFTITYKVPAKFLGGATSKIVISQIGISSQAIDPDPADSTNFVTTTVIK